MAPVNVGSDEAMRPQAFSIAPSLGEKIHLGFSSSQFQALASELGLTRGLWVAGLLFIG